MFISEFDKKGNTSIEQNHITGGLAIFLTGYSTVGKNLFADMIQNHPKLKKKRIKQFSFARPLRRDLRLFSERVLKIDINTKNPIKKEALRPFLVLYVEFKRKRTQGQYFINGIKGEIKHSLNTGHICLITDCRYAEYPKDELQYAKEAGLLVNIERYRILDGSPNNKEFVGPPNEHEARNGPKMKEAADWHVIWGDDKAEKQKCVDDFITFVQTIYKI